MDAWTYLRSVKHHMSKQQYRTIKGQLIAGDINGALKGMMIVCGRSMKHGTTQTDKKRST